MKYVFILVVGLLYWQCKSSNPRTVQTWVSISDTIVENRIEVEQNIMDSICLVKSVHYYQQAYDSIYVRRWQEIKYLMDSLNIAQ